MYTAILAICKILCLFKLFSDIKKFNDIKFKLINNHELLMEDSKKNI